MHQAGQQIVECAAFRPGTASKSADGPGRELTELGACVLLPTSSPTKGPAT